MRVLEIAFAEGLRAERDDSARTRVLRLRPFIGAGINRLLGERGLASARISLRALGAGNERAVILGAGLADHLAEGVALGALLGALGTRRAQWPGTGSLLPAPKRRNRVFR